MEAANSPYPDLRVIFDQDANNISGHTYITVDGSDEIFGKIFLFVDGQMYTVMDTPIEWPTLINSTCNSNGPHTFKIVGIDENYNVICGRTTTAVFNNELSAVTMSKGYEIGKDYYLYAFGSLSSDYIVEIKDSSDSNTVYSENFTGNIQAIIDPDAFAADSLIYDLTVKNSSTPENAIISTMISKAFNIEDYEDAKMVVSVGSADLESEDRCAQVIKAVIDAGKKRSGIGKEYIVPLTYSNSTWDTVKQCLLLPHVKIWVHFGHGYYGWRSVWNQIVEFNGESVSAQESWWYKHSMTELGFQETHKLNFVFFHTCYGAKKIQFAEALGILPIDDPIGIGTRAFISWHSFALSVDWYAWYNSYLEMLRASSLQAGKAYTMQKKR
jgi:hypothetical protein